MKIVYINIPQHEVEVHNIVLMLCPPHALSMQMSNFHRRWQLCLTRKKEMEINANKERKKERIKVLKCKRKGLVKFQQNVSTNSYT